jgi:uncharacterized protein
MARAAKEELLKDPVVARVREAVRSLYGDRRDRLVLYGSRARGEARPESDYDFAAFVRGLRRRVSELDRLSDAIWDVEVERSVGVDALPFPAEDYGSDYPFMQEVRAQGVSL